MIIGPLGSGFHGLKLIITTDLYSPNFESNEEIDRELSLITYKVR